MPSLKQLNDAVTAFIAEFPDDVISVVVDATFGHRIDPSEVDEFDAAVAHNELVAPPAGAIGRGDAFVLSIANKTKGSILSNDSYQEFHGEFPWLFDEGRLIGGKPVPNVGWVFVLRSPVRGPVSRKSVKAGRSVHKVTGHVPRASKEASQPMPVPKAPPPGATGPKRKDPEPKRRDPEPVTEQAAAPPRDAPVNDLMAFIDFVEHHPVGSSVNAVVESYSSHGAYVTVGPVRGYVPLRLMSDPPARTARELGKVGDAITLVVHSFTPARRSIDMAVPAASVKAGVTPRAEPAAVEAAVIAELAPGIAAPAPAPAPARPTRRRKAAAPEAATDEAAAPVAETKPPRTSRSRTTVAAPAEVAVPPEPATEPEAPPKKRRAAAPRSEPQTDEGSAPVEKAPSKRAANKSAPPPPELVPVPAKRAAAKKAAAKQAAPAPSAPDKAPAKKATAKKAPAKKAPAKKAPPATKAPAKRVRATSTSAEAPPDA